MDHFPTELWIPICLCQNVLTLFIKSILIWRYGGTKSMRKLRKS